MAWLLAWLQGMLWILKFLRAGGTWVAVAAIFGLLPLWFRVGHALVFQDTGVEWKDILKDGMLLYFSMAIVSAVTADYYLVDTQYPKYYQFYMMVMFPFLLYISCVYIIFETAGSKLEGDTLRQVLNMQETIAVGACVYALLHKGRHIVGVETEAEARTRE